jgi:hydroxypyruvate isomerase
VPKFSANLSMLFTEVPFLERFAAAAAAGFRAVEFVSPYDHPPTVIQGLLRGNGLTQALFNMPAGNWAAGERGIACLPGREDEFRSGLATTITYARALGAAKINCLAGIRPPQLPREVAEATLIDNLRLAAAALKAEGILLVVEAINPIDIPGFLLNTSAHAMSVIGRAGCDNLKFQYDIYHMQRVEGELARTIERLMPMIGHIQMAGNPGRTEPDRGEINYPYLYALIDRLGYEGWIGAEYHPVTTTRDGLGWLAGHKG